MPKRIALLIIGFVVFVGAFLLYQFISGASFLAGHGRPAVVVTTTRSSPLTFEFRTSTGELRYVITSATMEQIKDPVTKKEIPGQFLMHEPVATFFTHDGRTISIRGDTCQVAVDQLRHVNDSSGGKDVPQVRDGRLSGNIVLTISGKPPAAGVEDTGKDDTVVRFESDVLLSGADQLLTSPGKVQIRSNVIMFDGKGFTLNYSIDKSRADNSRLEYMRIDEGNKIILRNRGAKAFSLDEVGNKGKGGAASGPAATEGAATAPVNPENLPTAYQLSFGKDVRATHGTTVLTSDELFVLFTAPTNKAAVKAANKSMEEEAPVKPHVGTTQGAATRRVAGTLPAMEPMGEAGPEDLVITWVGPMIMRPVENTDMQLVDADDVALEAVGTAEKPVRVAEPKRWATAGKLWYQKKKQRLELAPGAAGKVEFSFTGNGNEATTVSCQGVSVYLDEKGQTATRVRLAGPGVLRVPASVVARKEASKDPVVARWDRVLDVDLGTAPDPKNAKKEIQVARHVVMNGASIKDSDFDLSADVLDLDIANVEGSSSGALQHLLATGNVSMKSFKKGSAGIEAQRLEVQTAMVAGQKAPVPSKVIADGEVKSWQMVEKKQAAGAVGAAGNDWRKQTVYGPHLEADLEPTAKGAAAAAQTKDTAGDMAADFGAVGGGKVKYFLVNGGIHITLESSKGDPVEVSAESLESKLPFAGAAGMVAKLTSKDKDHPVHIVSGKDEVFGDLVLLDQDKKTFEIPGAGHAFVELKDKKNKPGASTGAPQQMTVTWSKALGFDQKTMVATFTGDVAAVTEGKALEPGSLTCHQMLTVKLLNATGKAGETTDFETAGVGGLDYLTAEGKVDTRAAQFDANGTVLTYMDLSAETLTYSGVTHVLTVPVGGAMSLKDNRPVKEKVKVDDADPSTQSPRGDSLFGWEGSFTFDTDKNVITFNKKVVMRYTPLKAFHVAEEKDANGVVKPAAPVVLDSEFLQVTLVKTKEKAGANSVSPVGLGAGGNFALGTVTAGGVAGVGAATIQMDEFMLSGYTVGFDQMNHVVTAKGNENGTMRATVMRGNSGMVEADGIMWDLTKGANRFNFEGVPTGTFEAINDLQR